MADTTFTVSGSHGSLTVDRTSGAVVGRNAEGDEYAGIVRFDVAEYAAWLPTAGQELATVSEADILGIGYWDAFGIYEPPCHDWRADLVAMAER